MQFKSLLQHIKCIKSTDKISKKSQINEITW